MSDEQKNPFQDPDRLAVNGGPPVVSLPEGTRVSLREFAWGDWPVLSRPPRIGDDCWPAIPLLSGKPAAEQLAREIGPDGAGRLPTVFAVADGWLALLVTVMALLVRRYVDDEDRPAPAPAHPNIVASARLSELGSTLGVRYANDIDPRTGAWAPLVLEDVIDRDTTLAVVAALGVDAPDIAPLLQELADARGIGTVLHSWHGGLLARDGTHASKYVDAMTIATSGSALDWPSETGYIVVFDPRLAIRVEQMRSVVSALSGTLDGFALTEQARLRVTEHLRAGLSRSGSPWRMAHSGTALVFDPAYADDDSATAWERIGYDAAAAALAGELLIPIASSHTPPWSVDEIGDGQHMFPPELLLRDDVVGQVLRAVAKLCRAARAGELDDFARFYRL